MPIVEKTFRCRLPDWYLTRCQEAIGKMNGDHFWGYRPFALILRGFSGEAMHIPCVDGSTMVRTLLYFDFVPLIELRAAMGDDKPDFDEFVRETCSTIAMNLEGSVSLRSLGLK